MKKWELTSIALIALIGSLCLAYGVETAEDALDLEVTSPICKYINASETHQLNFSVGSNVTAASFILDFANDTSELEMVLITPSGSRIDSATGEPITYQRDNLSIYYIVPDPEPGEWTAEITARDVPETGEEYCASAVLDKEGAYMSGSPSNISDEELFPEECEDCGS
jgi:hypothetical protein